MATSLIRSPRILLALLATIVMMAFSLAAGSGKAEAAWQAFCNPAALPGNGHCVGSPFKMNQVYGWGDHHSVCVQLSNFNTTRRCSSGPGAGVYTPVFETITWYPTISNNAAGANTVHGIALGP